MPVFGQSDITGFTDAGFNWPVANNISVCGVFVLSEAGDVTKLTSYWSAANATVRVKGVIYSVNAGEPSQLLGTTDEITGVPNDDWKDMPFAAPVILAAGSYFLGIITDTSLTTVTSAAGTNRFDAVTYASGPLSTWDVAGDSNSSTRKPIYATYTVGGGGSEDRTGTATALSGSAALGPAVGTRNVNGTAQTLAGAATLGLAVGFPSRFGAAQALAGNAQLGLAVGYANDPPAVVVSDPWNPALGTLPHRWWVRVSHRGIW
jgi:hypothetical protein